MVSSSLATAPEGPKPEGALFVVRYPGYNQEDKVEELQKFIIA